MYIDGRNYADLLFHPAGFSFGRKEKTKSLRKKDDSYF